jgi:hemerythrin-like domain-containing protein
MERTNRRRFLLGAAGIGGAVVGSRVGHAKEEEEVSPTEDLMREHGVLRRLLLIYREVVRRLEENQTVKPEWIGRSAQIVHSFIEEYHEKDEEEYIFPRLKRAGKLAELVEVLIEQHRAGRNLTTEIQALATSSDWGSGASRQKMSRAMRLFVRMYEPHAAREDTVVFPLFASLIGERELKRMQAIFERKEKALPLGDFETMVSDVSNIEQALGIHDLRQFTPQ